MAKPHTYLVLSVLVASLVFLPAFAQVPLYQQGKSVDLLLYDVWIEPENPRDGDLITIHSIIYNAGVVNSSSATDVITIGYFVNGDLVHLDQLPDIMPGIENGIDLSSGQIFAATNKENVITVIVDYHDTLSDLVDNPRNNIVQKIFKTGTQTPTILSFKVSQISHGAKMQTIRVDGDLISLYGNTADQLITIDVTGLEKSTVMTDSNGKFRFKKEIPISNKPVKINVFFDGNEYLLSSSFTGKAYPISLDTKEAALLLKIANPSKNFSFKKPTWDIVLYQDSYDNMYKKINPQDSNLLNSSDEFLAKVPGGHKYILEIYFGGRYFDSTEDYFDDRTITEHEMIIPETAVIRFNVVDENGDPIGDASVSLGALSKKTNSNGYTDWIAVLPTVIKNEPYVTKIELSNGDVVWSEPFFVGSNERRTIQVEAGHAK